MKKIILHIIALAGLSIGTQSTNAQWQHLNGPSVTSAVNCIVVNGTDIFAGTKNDGIFLSTNNGASWTAHNNGMPSWAWSVGQLAVKGNNVVASNGFISNDTGNTWSEGGSGGGGYSFAVIGNKIFATATLGVYLSTNYGKTWTLTNNALTGVTVYSLAISGTNMFSVSDEGIFISPDTGINWNIINNGLIDSSYIRSLTVSGANIYVATPYSRVYLSSDTGANWVLDSTGLSGKYINSLASDSTNVFAATSTGVYLSTDSGAHWIAVNHGLTDSSVNSITISGARIFAATDGGVFLSSNNAVSWTAINNGLIDRLSIGSLASSGTDLFASGDYGVGVFKSSDNGASWAAVNNGLQMSTYFGPFAVEGTTTFLATTYAGIYNTTDNGASWTSVNNGLPADDDWTGPFGVSGSNVILSTISEGLYLSADNGANWGAVTDTTIRVSEFASNGTDIFGGTYDGRILSSSDGGMDWWQIGNGLPSGNWINALAINGTNIFAGYNWSCNYCPGIGGVYLSTDYGSNWTDVSNDLPYTSIWEKYYPVPSLVTAGGNVFAVVTWYGVYLSTNNGSNWTPFNQGLDADSLVGINSIAVIGTDIYITTGHGIWRRPLSDVLAVGEKAVDEANNLSVYPNPAMNKLIVTAYSLTGKSELKIYDVLGKTLYESEIQNPKSEIDITSLSPGIYFLQLRTESGNAVQKFVKQ